MIAEKEKAKLAAALLASVGLERFWTVPDIGADVGPSPKMWEEIDDIKAYDSLLSHGEKMVMLIAHDIWNGGSHVSIYEMWSHLAPETVHLIADTIKQCLPIPD
jgi:hypothetical protein